MTLPPADAPSLPLSVTCTADAVFGEAIVSLARRVAGGGLEGGDEAGSRRFAGAVEAGVSQCLAHLGAGEGRTLEVQLSSVADHWLGELRWVTDGDGDRAALSTLQRTLEPLCETVECSHDGTHASCSLRCRRD